jgi:hypothetical protein
VRWLNEDLLARCGVLGDDHPDTLRARLGGLTMAKIVLRVRLIGGDHMDVTYESEMDAEAEVVEHVVSTLAEDSGVLRSRHGERLVVLYGRGVAAIEVAPRGAVV